MTENDPLQPFTPDAANVNFWIAKLTLTDV